MRTKIPDISFKLLMRFLLIFILALFSFDSAAQKDEVYTGKPDTATSLKKPRNFDWLENVTYGGNFLAWFGNPSFVFLSPTVGYAPVEQINIGTGLIYNYLSQNDGYYGRYTHNIFGGHSYFRYIIAESYMLQVQYDKLRQPNYLSYTPGEKIWIDYVLVGGGFRHRLSDNAALTSSLMYNLTPHQLSIYPTRMIIQFGFMGGF